VSRIDDDVTEILPATGSGTARFGLTSRGVLVYQYHGERHGWTRSGVERCAVTASEWRPVLPGSREAEVYSRRVSAEPERALRCPGPEAEAIVAEGLASGELVVINLNSVSPGGLRWLSPGELGDDQPGGCWILGTGFVAVRDGGAS
jgi:hypothetical protein